MDDTNRFKLLFGPYRAPRCKVGSVLFCAVRGQVRVASWSSGRIPWPRSRIKGGNPLIVCGGLLRALLRESALAVRHWFGIGSDTVWKLRRALEVAKFNDGTRRLFRDWAPEKAELRDPEKFLAALQAPGRRAKIAASKRGKPRPAHVLEAVRQAHLGKPLSLEQRRKMSETHKRRGTRPPAVKGPAWSAEEDALLGTMSDQEVAERTGRTNSAVKQRRAKIARARLKD